MRKILASVNLTIFCNFWNQYHKFEIENLVTMYCKMQIYSKNWKWFLKIHDLFNIHWTMWNNPNDSYIVCNGIIIRNDVKFVCCVFGLGLRVRIEWHLIPCWELLMIWTNNCQTTIWGMVDFLHFAKLPNHILLAFFALIFQHKIFAKCKGNFHDLWSASTCYHLLISPRLASCTSQKINYRFFLLSSSHSKGISIQLMEPFCVLTINHCDKSLHSPQPHHPREVQNLENNHRFNPLTLTEVKSEREYNERVWWSLIS